MEIMWKMVFTRNKKLNVKTVQYLAMKHITFGPRKQKKEIFWFSKLYTLMMHFCSVFFVLPYLQFHASVTIIFVLAPLSWQFLPRIPLIWICDWLVEFVFVLMLSQIACWSNLYVLLGAYNDSLHLYPPHPKKCSGAV